MLDRPILSSEKGKAKCKPHDDDDSPNQDKAAPACDEIAVEQDAHTVEDAPTH